MIVLFLVGTISLLVMLYIFEQYRTRRMRSMVKNMPGMKGYPLVGSAFAAGSNSVDYLNTMIEQVKSLGPVFHLWMGPLLYVILSDPKDVEVLLSSSTHVNKASVYIFLKDWIGISLVNSPGPLWKIQRTVLTPAFHIQILASYIEIFNDNVTIMVKLLEKEVGKDKFNIEPYLDECALDALCETAMATKVNAQLNKESMFPKALKIVSRSMIERAFRPWLFPDFTFRLSPIGRKFRKHMDYINSFIDNVIIQKKNLLELKKKSLTSLQDTQKMDSIKGSKKRLAFLDLLLSYAEDPSSQLTLTDIREQVNTFMFAGHDTIAATVGFAIYLLGQHTDIQDKVLEEVNNVFGESGRDPDYSDLKNLKYMGQVIKETLRIYPAVPYIGRKLLEDLSLPSGHTLPAGTEVVVMIQQMHRNPKIFPNPKQFNPDNFLPEKMDGRFLFSYIPFSAGPRNCIGPKFAMLEMKATLSKLIQTFKITSDAPEPLLAAEITLRSKTGINVRLEKRN